MFCGCVEIWEVDKGMEDGKRRSSKIRDIVSYALRIGVTPVFVVYLCHKAYIIYLACMYMSSLVCVHIKSLTVKKIPAEGPG